MTSILPILSYTYSYPDASVNGISNYTTETWSGFDGTLTIPETTIDSGITYNVVGYTTFGGGTPFMKIQYGIATTNGTPIASNFYGTMSASNYIYFSPSFNAIPYMFATAYGGDESTGSTNIASIETVSATSFRVYCTSYGSNSVQFYWFAIGY